MDEIEIYNYGANPEKNRQDLQTYSDPKKKKEYKEIILKTVKKIENPAATDFKPRIFKIFPKRRIVLYSYVFGGREKDGAPALSSFNFILELEIYKENHIEPTIFEQCLEFLKEDWDFGISYPTGNISPIEMEIKKGEYRIALGGKKRKIERTEKIESLKRRRGCLKKIISILLENKKLRVVTNNNTSPRDLAKIACEIYSFLPEGRRELSYTTGNPKNIENFGLIISKEKPRLEDTTENIETVDLSEEIEFKKKNNWDKIANHAVNSYFESGQDGLDNFHQEWKNNLSESEHLEKIAKKFIYDKDIDTEEQSDLKYLKGLKVFLPENKEKFLEKTERRMESSGKRDDIGEFLATKCKDIKFIEVSEKEYPTLKKWWKSNRQNYLKRVLEECETHLEKGNYRKVKRTAFSILKNLQKESEKNTFEIFLETSKNYFKAISESEQEDPSVGLLLKEAKKFNFDNRERCRILEVINRQTDSRYDSSEIIAYSGPKKFCDVILMIEDDWKFGKPRFVRNLTGEKKPLEDKIKEYLVTHRYFALPTILSGLDEKTELAKILGLLIRGSGKHLKTKEFIELILEKLDKEISGGLSRITNRFPVIGSKQNEIRDLETFKIISYEILVPLIYLIKKYKDGSLKDFKDNIEIITQNLFSLKRSEYRTDELSKLFRKVKEDYLEKEKDPDKNGKQFNRKSLIKSEEREILRLIAKNIKEEGLSDLLNDERDPKLSRNLIKMADSPFNYGNNLEKVIGDLIDSFERELEKKDKIPVYKLQTLKIIVPFIYINHELELEYENRLKKVLNESIERTFELEKNQLKSIFSKLKS